MNLFPYPGNKAQHANWILDYLPNHHCYVEVFGGAAGVLFNKEPSPVEIYNDRDRDLVQFFEVLRDRPDELREWLSAVPFARDLHADWAEAFYNGERPSDPVERAGRFFYLRYAQWGGKYYSNSGFACSKTRNGATSFRNKVEGLDGFADRLRSVVIENEPWGKMFERYDGDGTLFYLDPPYRETEYQYDAEGFDHRALYEEIRDADGYCVLSYDSVPEWYGDEFEVVSKDAGFAIDNANSSGPKDATEYLILNFDPSETPRFQHAAQTSVADF